MKSLGGNDTAPKIEKKAYLKYSALLDQSFLQTPLDDCYQLTRANKKGWDTKHLPGPCNSKNFHHLDLHNSTPSTEKVLAGLCTPQS